jgi:hypothetical protein
MDKSNYLTEAEVLADTIQKVAARVSFAGTKQDSAHAEFLLEMIEEMEAQVASIRYAKAD